jgi:hypothetical protein
LNKTDSNNLNTLRQKLRQYLNQQSFQNEINEYHDDVDLPTLQNNNQQESTVVTLMNEEILKKLDEIISIRGKHGINYQNQLECLNILRQNVEQQNLGIEILIKILLIQITVCFDYQLWTR